MSIRRRLLSGIGDAGQMLANAWAQNVHQQQQQAFDLSKLRIGELNALTNNLATNPDRAGFYLHAADANPLLAGSDLGPIREASRGMGIQNLLRSLNTAASPEAMPADLGTALSLQTGDRYPSIPLGNAAQFGAQADYADAPPALQDVLRTATARLGQLQDAKEGQIEDIGRKKFAEAQGSTSGTNAANNANFPTVLGQKLQEGQQANQLGLEKERQTNPILAEREKLLSPILVARAGATAGAQERAKLAPDIIAGETTKAGAIAGAQQANKPPDDKARQNVSFYIRSVEAANRAKDLEDQGVSPARAAWLPNAVQGEAARRYNQAQREFVLAALRKETGAAISAKEMDQFAQAYFAAPGDDPQTLAAKQTARNKLIEGLKYEANQGLGEFQKLGNSVPTVITPGNTLNKLLGGGK